MGIVNEARLKDEATAALRVQCAKRASTIALTLEEAAKEGLDDSHARRAIFRYGQAIGDDLRASMKDPADLREFATKFGVGLDRNIYEMETVAADADRLSIRFHYCPYVAQWLKMGKSAEEIDTLCDIAMEGDRGIGSRFEAFEFVLGKTIAQGNPVCEVDFRRAKKGSAR
jgi:predicted ArsR family transcriptional regulator